MLIALPTFEGFVSELSPQPTDPNTTTGYVSVADLRAIFRKVYDQNVSMRAEIQNLQQRVAALEAQP